MRNLRAASQILVEESGAEVTAWDIARVSRAAEILRQRFPAEAEILPTALGNALRAAERRAGDRYGLDAIVLWPRLHVVMPSNTKAAVNSARDELDLLAGLTVSFVVAALVALVFTAQHDWWLGLPFVLLLLAALAYRGTVASAIRYGVMVAVAFDLHRFELLAALHVPLPSDSAAERLLYSSLEKVLRGIPARATGALPNLTYSHPEPTKTPAARPANGGDGRNAPEKNAREEEAEDARRASEDESETEAEVDDAAEQARPAGEVNLAWEPRRV